MDSDPSICVTTEAVIHMRFIKFRLFPFRSPLLREFPSAKTTKNKLHIYIVNKLLAIQSFSEGLFSFPPATKMFQFAGLSRH